MAQDTQGKPRAWWPVAGLLIAAFLARGPLYLSVFPPFEGWDEYQHLAYIVHLDETGTIPVVDERTRVPLAIRPLVLAVPHSPSGADQLGEWGALSYAEYWDNQRRAGGAATSSPRLYQAQHPPLAYALDLPIWRAFKPHGLEAIYAIRALNLLIVAAALVLFAAALSRLVPAFGPRVAVLALVCLHPLFFQNVARVANDALAVATGVAGISLLVLADGRTLLTRGVLAAACIAASIWSKQTGLTLAPALVLGVSLIGWGHGVSTGRLWRATTIVSLVLLLLVAPLWLWNYRHYGTMIAADESLQLAARGSVVNALAASFMALHWGTVLELLFVPGRAWVGGWSYLPTHETLAGLYAWYYSLLLGAAGVGAVVATLRRARRVEPALAVCAAVVIFTVLGLLYHALVSNAVFGRPMTNPWYFMAALPFLFVLLVRGLAALNRRLATAACAALAVLFVAIDLYGTWIEMPTFYTITTDTALQWSRLSAMHPGILKGHSRWWFLAAQLGALCLAAGGMVLARRNRA